MKVQIQNFRCFRKLSIYDFEDEKISLLRGNSGAGKSTLLESIRWCLFGNLRNIYPSGFTPTATNKTFVTLEIKNLNITRSQAPEQLKVTIFKENETEELMYDSAQQYINNIFGNRNTWIASSFIRQNERCPLMVGSNAERMTLLNEILFGNDNTSIYENPDYYTDKIDEQLSLIDKEITGQTAVFNSYYNKYVSGMNLFDNPHKWTTMDLQTIQGFTNYIAQAEAYLKVLNEELLQISSVENRKQMLEAKLATFTFDMENLDLNSNETQKIEGLSQELKSLDLQYNNTKSQLNQLTYNQSRHVSLNNELEFQRSSLQKRTPLNVALYTAQTVSDMNTKLAKTKHDIATLKANLSQLLQSETQIASVKFSLSSAETSYKTLQETLFKYESTDINVLNRLLNNRLLQDKLNAVQIKLSKFDKIGKFNELGTCAKEQLDQQKRDLESKLLDLRFAIGVCNKHSLNIDSVRESVNLASEKLTFYESQKQHLVNKSQYDTTLKSIQDFQVQIVTKDLENLTEFSIKEEINLIRTRLGAPLKCPSCQCTLEMKNNVLCIPSSEIIDTTEGLQRIEKLNSLLTILSRNAQLENSINMLKNKLDLIPPFEETYTSAPVLSLQEVEKYRNIITDTAKINYGVLHLDLASLEANLETLREAEQYSTLKQEEEELKRNIGTDAFLTLKTTEELRRDVASLPLVLNNYNEVSKNVKNLQESLKTLQDQITQSKTSEILKQEIGTLEQEVQSTETLLQEISVQTSIVNSINKLSAELAALNFDVKNMEQLQELLVTLEAKRQELEAQIAFLERKNREYLDYIQTKNELSKIVIEKTSAQVKETISIYTKACEDQRLMETKAKEMYRLCEEKRNLESLHAKVTELTSKQTVLNSLKNLVVEVTNSTLQNLVDSINNTTNTILEELFDNSIVVELKLYREIKNKQKIKPQVNISIYYNGNVYDNVSSLSGGESDRISLAMTLALAIIHTSPVVFLDECMAALDTDLREQCLETIKKFLVEQGNKTVINIEHGGICGLYDMTVNV
jgi:DNA repair exonuclease SbcCD ATPase subunit